MLVTRSSTNNNRMSQPVRLNMNQKNFKMTRHAKERLEQRSQASPDVFVAALSERGVVTRSEPDGIFENILVWMPEDSMVFVAAANRFTGEVVTVYPVIREETGALAMMTDGKPFDERRWEDFPRVRDLRYAVLRVESELPPEDHPISKVIYQDAEYRRSLIPRTPKKPPSLRPRLRVTFDDGHLLLLKIDPEIEVSEECCEEDVESLLPQLFDRLAKHLLANPDRADQVESISAEVTWFQRGKLMGGEPIWSRLLMAQGVAGESCVSLLSDALKRQRAAMNSVTH